MLTALFNYRWLLPLCFLLLTGCGGQINDQTADVTLVNRDDLLNEAAQNYSDKKWSASYKIYRELVEISDVNSEIWFRLGVSAYRLDKLKEAEFYFEQVVRQEPRHRKALFNLTLLSLGKGTQYLDQYIQVTPPEQRQPALEKTLNDLQNLGW